MKLMLTFFRSYPLQSIVMLIALLFAGIAEGVGLSVLLPLLNIAIKTDARTAGAAAAEQSELESVIIDILGNMGVQASIGTLLITMVAVMTVRSLLLLVAKKRIGYTAARISMDLRLELLTVMLKSRWEYFLHQPIGKLTNSMATEAQRSSEAFLDGTTVVSLFIQAVIYAGIALAISWKATLFSLAAGVLLIAMTHTLVRISKKAGKQQTLLLTSLLSRLTDTLQSVKPLKAMAREHLVNPVLSMETAGINQAMERQVFSKAMLGVVQEETGTVIAAIGMYVALVKLEVPLATVMIMVVILSRMLSQLNKVQKQYQNMAANESAYWSMKQVIQLARDAEEKLDAESRDKIKPTLARGIRLERICMSYDGEHNFLDELSLEIPAGLVTTLVGASGCGKTTIVDMIMALLQPTGGTLLIDDVPLDELDIRTWRQMIGYVPQETVLLHDTVLHNVTLGDPNLTEHDAELALRSANAWEFVSAMAEGMHSSVGERGGKLSGGQRQRIVIARALVNNPELLILDEATSALDADSEAAIRATIERLRGKLTVLTISHQSSLVEVADRVYRLEGNRATMIGNSSTTL